MSTKKQLTARKANKLAVELQVVLIKALTIALKFSFNGKSMLWGKEVGEHDLAEAKNKLVLLDRQKELYESDKYAKLPYLPSNGTGVNKHKAHFASSGIVNFLEVTDATKGAGAERHLNSKQVVTKQIRHSLKNNKQSPSKVEATKMATAKKSTTAVSKKKAASPSKKGSGPTAQDFRDAYDKNPKTFNSAEYAAKHGVAYGRVYGAIVKHVGGKENVGKVVKKAAAKKEVAS